MFNYEWEKIRKPLHISQDEIDEFHRNAKKRYRIEQRVKQMEARVEKDKNNPNIEMDREYRQKLDQESA